MEGQAAHHPLIPELGSLSSSQLTNVLFPPPTSNSAPLHEEALELHKGSAVGRSQAPRAEVGFCRTVYLYRSVDSASSKVSFDEAADLTFSSSHMWTAL